MNTLNKTNISDLVIRAIDEGKLPQFLYKYRTIESTETILTKGSIWFSKLSEFNDPFEGQAIIQDNYTEEQWYNYLVQNGWNPSVASKKAKELVTNNIQEARNIVRTAIDNQSKITGFYCLSGVHNNLLMWSHYADSHKGCVIEYDLKKCLPLFERINSVKYDNNYPAYNYLQDQAGPFNTIYHKSKNWEYENEYRIMGTPGAVDLPDEAISAIIFGCKTSKANKTRIKNLLSQSKFKNATIKQATMDQSSYKLNIV